MDSDTVWRRMDRALEMADLMADTHGDILAMEENAVNRSGRLRNRERTGHDWIEARTKDVREHFFATYLDMGGGTSRGLQNERRPRPLEPMEVETSPSVRDHLQRSFLLAVKLATIEQTNSPKLPHGRTGYQGLGSRRSREKHWPLGCNS